MIKISRVYAVQEPMKWDNEKQEQVRIMDITKASEYGTIEVLLSNASVAFAPGPMLNTLMKKLKDFGDDDYLIAIGDPSAIAAAVMIASNNNRGKINLLKWDKKAREYLKIHLDINRKGE